MDASLSRILLSSASSWSEPEAFDPRAATLAGLFAGHSGALLHGADAVAQLTEALAGRDVVGRVTGVLMERFRITNDRAFEMLARSGQETGTTIVDVARWLTDDLEAVAEG